MIGPQNLEDNSILFEYKQEHLSATDLYKGMCNGDIDTDELNKAYLPYMDKEFRWTNDEKCYILSEIDQAIKVLYPGEIKILLNQYRQ